MRIAIRLLLLLALCRFAVPAQSDPAAKAIEFNRDIRPILSDKCFTCHGPNKANRLTKLRFDVEADAKKDLGGRYAIVPGDPVKSQMVQRITAADPARRMPPVTSGRTLTGDEIERIRLWIAQGAKWEKHWSFIPPRRAAIPEVKERGWPRNSIDYFVLNRLEQEGLRPSPEADRATLIRRVTLDLTGLPPTPQEVDAFVADQSPKAYERVVDRLLQSPRYGERMAFTWLDAARYSDTNGYQGDGERQMWRWRDWVINAFNRNMPFNQFTIEQLAGDLLPNPTLDQRIATGFNRNHRGNSEGGIIPEEYAVEYVVDRVETTSTVFFGLTLGCARCHDHKYDPFSQKEFYQLFAYFNNVPESGRFRRSGNSPPFIPAPTPDQQAQLKHLDEQLASANDNFATLEPRLEKTQSEWEKSLDKSTPVDWAPTRRLLAHYPLDGDLTGETSVSKESQASAAKFQEGEAQFVHGRIGQAAGFDGKCFIDAGNIPGFFDSGNLGRSGYRNTARSGSGEFTVGAWIYPTADSGAIVTRAAEESEPRGFGFNLKDGKIQVNMVSRWLDDGIRVETEAPLDLNRWHHVMATYDGTRVADGIKIYVNGKEQRLKILLDYYSANAAKEPVRIGGGGGRENRFHGSIDDVRVYDRALSHEEAAILASSTSVTEIAALAPGKRSRAEADKIRGYFLENTAPADIQEAWRKLVEIRVRREQFYASLPSVMVMEDMAVPRETHVLIRGSYDRPGEKVDPGLPAILPPMSKEYPNNRLGLARWLVDPSNPLTARVTVNRFWQMYFGAGLVKTVEDFGAQGEPPSHPKVLDWLATEFVSTGWDVKALQKTIVTSATYRQSSKVTPELLQKDPDNRLFARGPSFRISAEMVRDQALANAGLLVEKIRGPSVKPYQPEGLWTELSGQSYQQEHGENLYRRSLYTFWKRTITPPTMANFDASSRETCVVRHSLTNTPLQALDLMNDVTFVEAARVLAERMMKQGGTTPEDRIAFAFRVATARLPNSKENNLLLESFNYQLENFKRKPDAALNYVSQGEYPRDKHLDVSELAAYASVASLILNLDETVTKE
jgi:hypothetical protein